MIVFAMIFRIMDRISNGATFMIDGQPGAISFSDSLDFSLITMSTVGYGDITPLTAPAQSLTLVMNIIGQFYLAIVIGVFVGKYISCPPA